MKGVKTAVHLLHVHAQRSLVPLCLYLPCARAVTRNLNLGIDIDALSVGPIVNVCNKIFVGIVVSPLGHLALTITAPGSEMQWVTAAALIHSQPLSLLSRGVRVNLFIPSHIQEVNRVSIDDFKDSSKTENIMGIGVPKGEAVQGAPCHPPRCLPAEQVAEHQQAPADQHQHPLPPSALVQSSCAHPTPRHHAAGNFPPALPSRHAPRAVEQGQPVDNRAGRDATATAQQRPATPSQLQAPTTPSSTSLQRVEFPLDLRKPSPRDPRTRFGTPAISSTESCLPQLPSTSNSSGGDSEPVSNLANIPSVFSRYPRGVPTPAFQISQGKRLSIADYQNRRSVIDAANTIIPKKRKSRSYGLPRASTQRYRKTLRLRLEEAEIQLSEYSAQIKLLESEHSEIAATVIGIENQLFDNQISIQQLESKFSNLSIADVQGA
ncbi:hypothetical protein QAD02_016880 [Eretmocerus hayati]|uniref:Uncharacterized protein n=1 Tax=Eretmocerus hayati TaxID=131215 RepID=A0ACC2PDC6_9HYME|nr:hypothetical protein QAD02_016880 [Eretmocerus hayati]